MAKIKHVSGYEFDTEKLKRINEVFVSDCRAAGIPSSTLTRENIDIILYDLNDTLLAERDELKNMGIQVSEEQIKAEFKKIPWWKRWFMFSKQKKLERAKITLDLITRKRNEQ